MKLKCVKNVGEEENLTIGRVYDSSILKGLNHIFIGYEFILVAVVFNDKKEWRTYPLDLFIPLFGGER